METHLAFTLKRSDVRGGILVPKYYDPELELANELASDDFDLPQLQEVLLPGEKGSRLGDWIRRDLYGTGTIPFVRTSDLSHWRIRPDYKKGVSEDVYEKLKKKQDVAAGDILMVAHGTYLVGTVAMVTNEDERLVLQDHVFRLRVNPEFGVHPNLLLAALSTNFVRRQVRTRQFSADIIDKIGERHLGIRVPVPKDGSIRERVVQAVDEILREQTATRRAIREVSRSDMRMTPARTESRYAFGVQRSEVVRRILIPKYYDPQLEADLVAVAADDPAPWVTLGSLIKRGLLSAETGVEVGKMAYGTGPVPFIRTSDITDWEIRRDTKHSVSEGIYSAYSSNGGLEEKDILLVRDGTYLVGSSAMVMKEDLPALYCGGIYRLRSEDPNELNPYALLAFLNLPIVRRQMRARQFTRDVIDTLGRRIREIRIPSPFTREAAELAGRVEDTMNRKARVKGAIGATVHQLEPPQPSITKNRPGWSMR